MSDFHASSLIGKKFHWVYLYSSLLGAPPVPAYGRWLLIQGVNSLHLAGIRSRLARANLLAEVDHTND